jgi:hypothetical protein
MSDMMDDWVLRVLGVDVRAMRRGGFTREVIASFTERLTVLREDLQRLGMLADLGSDLARAAEAVKARDPAVFGLIDVLETRVAEIAAQRRREQAEAETKRAAPGKSGVVGFAKVRLKWDAARNAFHTAGANLETAARTLLTTQGFVADPRSGSPQLEPKLKAIAEKLPDIEKLSDALDFALDQIGTAENSLKQDGQSREDRTAVAVKAIDNYLAELAKQPMLKALQSGEAGGLPIVDAIEASVTALRAELAG